MAEQDLREELDAVVNELNSRKFRPDDAYQYEIGEHNDGLAIDITKEGSAVKKVLGQFCKAAMRAGYVVSATAVMDRAMKFDKTRVFLHEADEHFAEVNEDKARAEGFMAGLFMGTTLAMNNEQTHEVEYEDLESLYPNVTDQLEVMDTEEAIEYLEDNNPYDEYPSRGGFVSTPDEDYGDHDIYVASSSADVDDYDVPDGWTGERTDDGLGLVFRKETPSTPDPNEFERADADINEDELDHDVDIDAEKIMRELEGVETAHDAVEWIHENEGTERVAHVSHKGPADDSQPFVTTSVDEVPSGWEYDTRTDYGEDEANYLRKA